MRSSEFIELCSRAIEMHSYVSSYMRVKDSVYADLDQLIADAAICDFTGVFDENFLSSNPSFGCGEPFFKLHKGELGLEFWLDSKSFCSFTYNIISSSSECFNTTRALNTVEVDVVNKLTHLFDTMVFTSAVKFELLMLFYFFRALSYPITGDSVRNSVQVEAFTALRTVVLKYEQCVDKVKFVHMFENQYYDANNFHLPLTSVPQMSVFAEAVTTAL